MFNCIGNLAVTTSVGKMQKGHAVLLCKIEDNKISCDETNKIELGGSTPKGSTILIVKVKVKKNNDKKLVASINVALAHTGQVMKLVARFLTSLLLLSFSKQNQHPPLQRL